MAKVNIKEDMKNKEVTQESKEPDLSQLLPQSKVTYSKDTIEGDKSIYEVYEGTVEDVLILMGESQLVYNQEDAIDFIKDEFEKDGKSEVTREVVRDLLNYEEDYMRSVGIIGD